MTNPVKKFFLFCSGASNTILEMKGCEVEHNKYAGIGATVFFTATLAALSGGYAMFTVFQSAAISFAFGLLWGLIIFNLDRFIVSSIRKQGASMKKGEFRKALPRLILAIFISIVITRPLELKLFGVEIQEQITKDLIQERVKLESDINIEYADIDKLEKETEKLRTRRTELQNEWNRRTNVASSELEGWGGTKNPGDGVEYKKRLAEANQAKQELDAFKEQYEPIIKANETQIDRRKKERDDKISMTKTQIDNSRGLLKQLEGLSKLTSNHLSIFLASGFIILLFISLETAPILVKLFSSRGPYDDYLDAIEHRVYATQQKNISDINDEINSSVALGKQLNLDRIQAELQFSRNTFASLQTLAPQEFQDAQVEIARKAIAMWRKGQSNLLNNVTPPATYSGQSSKSGIQSAPPVTTPTSPTNITQPPGPTGIPMPAGAGGVPSSSNNGGSHTSAGTAGAQPPASATTPPGTSPPGQQTSTGATQSPTGANPTTSTP